MILGFFLETATIGVEFIIKFKLNQWNLHCWGIDNFNNKLYLTLRKTDTFQITIIIIKFVKYIQELK